MGRNTGVVASRNPSRAVINAPLTHNSVPDASVLPEAGYPTSGGHHTRPTATARAPARYVPNQAVSVYLEDVGTWTPGCVVEEVTRVSDGTTRYAVIFYSGGVERTGSFYLKNIQTRAV